MFTGTVFAMTSMIESLTPIAASPLYTFVYNATLLTFPGTFYIVSSAIFGLDVILLRCVAACRNLSVGQATTTNSYSMRGEEELFIVRAQKEDNNILFTEHGRKSNIARDPKMGCL
jgi:hypothetical protein